jgi:hypothetical protein
MATFVPKKNLPTPPPPPPPRKTLFPPINFHKTDSPKKKQHEKLSMSMGKVDKM